MAEKPDSNFKLLGLKGLTEDQSEITLINYCNYRAFCEKYYNGELLKNPELEKLSEYLDMTEISGLDLTEFRMVKQLYFERVLSNTSAKKPPDPDSDKKGLKKVLKTLKMMKSAIISSFNIIDSNVVEMTDGVNVARHLVKKLLDDNKQNRGKVQISAKDYAQKKIKNFNNRAQKAGQLNNEPPSSDQATSLEKEKSVKSKGLIIKIKNAQEFLKPINSQIKRFSVNSVGVLGKNKILLIFKYQQECKEFKDQFEKFFPRIKLFVEEDENVEVILYNAANIPINNLKHEIEKITNERPYYIAVIKKDEKKTQNVFVLFSSMGFLKLQAENEFTIRVKNVKYHYNKLHEKDVFQSLMKKTCCLEPKQL